MGSVAGGGLSAQDTRNGVSTTGGGIGGVNTPGHRGELPPAEVGPTTGLRGGGVRGFIPRGETAASGGFGFGGGGGAGLGESKIAGVSKQHFRVSPPQFKGESKEYPGWRTDFLRSAGFHDLLEVFEGQGVMPDTTKTRSSLLQEGFLGAQITASFQAFQYLSASIIGSADKAIIRRCKSPREALEQLDSVHKPETQGAIQNLLNRFQSFKISSGSNPIEAMHDLESIRDHLNDSGEVNLDERLLFSRLLDALPSDEYEIAQQTLASYKVLTRSDIIRVVGTQYTSLCNKKEKEGQRKKQVQQQAFFAGDGGGGGRGWQDNRGRGGKGRGRGGGNQKGTEDGPSGGSSNSSSEAGGGARRCYRCRRRGHIKPDCTTKECDFLPQCANCSGFGHKESSCPSETAMLAFQITEEEFTEEELAVEVAAF